MINQEKKPATLHDVARLAEVSYQTVSRVINDHPSVSKKTRERVNQAIQSLNFRPNKAAQALNTGRSRTLQIITFDMAFASYLLRDLILAARDLGYLIAFSAIYDPTSQEELDTLMDSLAGRVFDGFVWISVGPSKDVEQIAEITGDVPYVMIGGASGAQMPSVIFDQDFGMQVALNHLYNLGHRKIAEISGWSGSYDGAARHQAYLDFMAEKGLAPNWVEGMFDAASGYRGVQTLLEQGEKFSGLVCGNDKTAAGALRALHERGIRVPQDVSVVGYDDLEGMDYTIPPLTTVRQDFGALGKQAIDYLVMMIENPGTPHLQRVLYPQLVVRESTRKIA